jgi:hypothetical protein
VDFSVCIHFYLLLQRREKSTPPIIRGTCAFESKFRVFWEVSEFVSCYIVGNKIFFRKNENFYFLHSFLFENQDRPKTEDPSLKTKNNGFSFNCVLGRFYFLEQAHSTSYLWHMTWLRSFDSAQDEEGGRFTNHPYTRRIVLPRYCQGTSYKGVIKNNILSFPKIYVQ